jgi:hypothetical protein
MVWLAGFLIGIIVLLSLVVARERAARRRRNRTIRSSIEPTLYQFCTTFVDKSKRWG